MGPQLLLDSTLFLLYFYIRNVLASAVVLLIRVIAWPNHHTRRGLRSSLPWRKKEQEKTPQASAVQRLMLWVYILRIYNPDSSAVLEAGGWRASSPLDETKITQQDAGPHLLQACRWLGCGWHRSTGQSPRSLCFRHATRPLALLLRYGKVYFVNAARTVDIGDIVSSSAALFHDLHYGYMCRFDQLGFLCSK